MSAGRADWLREVNPLASPDSKVERGKEICTSMPSSLMRALEPPLLLHTLTTCCMNRSSPRLVVFAVCVAVLIALSDAAECGFSINKVEYLARHWVPCKCFIKMRHCRAPSAVQG
jgi:hypothetical protein